MKEFLFHDIQFYREAETLRAMCYVKLSSMAQVFRRQKNAEWQQTKQRVLVKINL